MPSYMKFLKDILTKKRKLEYFETITLTKECSGIIQNKFPPKLKDLRSFSILCSIGNFNFSKVLFDLDAGVSIMSLSIARRIKLNEIQPTTITLHLADKTIRHLYGVIENVLFKVRTLFILVDFMVLEMEENQKVLIILGHPFLANVGALIDVREDRITFIVEEEVIEFTLFNATRVLQPQLIAIEWT
ncbi:PREDICTED: uncharacterized protein LOC108661359 [Theobroma cacao]|uniref:Uncharacterized protein LOC108661359 n=1 Tax=Theobroma cacao TaxID=3641 RepID=A0AB32W269_THECC|nr:PREDICTED: uncharacterized protein LOC108661359 [Theobroma cacao]